MEHVRRVRILAPIAAILVVGAVGLTLPAALRAGDPPWDPPPCPPAGSPAHANDGAWFALDPDLDADGWLVGRHLTLGEVAGHGTHRMDLPPESFGSGPVHGRLLVGDDDGIRSRLRLVDVAADCAGEIGAEASVVRSALLQPDGGTLWEHRVSRATRADEGVWRRPLDGRPPTQVLPGIEPDAAFGPTFSTELALADDGRLVVTSCGELRCRTRVVDPGTGRVDRVDDTGPVLGIAAGRLIAYRPCHGYPCAIEAIDPGSGGRSMLVAAAGPAALGSTDGGALAYETSSGAVAVLDLLTLRVVVVRADGWVPVRDSSGATSGADVGPGTVLLAPGGHLTDPATARRLDAASGDVRPLREVAP